MNPFKSLHAKALRGLVPSAGGPNSRFKFMFPGLEPATFGSTEKENETNLGALANAMINKFDAPKDGPDDEESSIPALYTYLGQFIDHDLTFDPTSSLAKFNDPNLEDFRTPAFDLDNLYGRGPDDQPYMYDGDDTFLLGSPITGGSDWFAFDLPRNSAIPARALIGDPRNDENSIVSQLQGLFLRFHNRMRRKNPKVPFGEVQTLVRHHYQHVVLNDFLPRIVSKTVLDSLKTNGKWDRTKIKFYDLKCTPYIPFEFAVAAYRLGHSMVRPGYRLNDNSATLLPIFPAPDEGFTEGLTGFRAMNPLWGIDWGRFIDIDERSYGEPDKTTPENMRRLQLAYRIDTSAVFPLGNLPGIVASGVVSLPERNLLRGWRMKMPSGQSVAKAMGETPLTDDQILIGTFTDDALDDPKKNLKPIGDVKPVFEGNCPLWTYILAETRQHADTKDPFPTPTIEKKKVTTPQLGAVGGRIVAETFLGVLFGDSTSILNCKDPKSLPPDNFKLKDLVLSALGS